jgi:hypothetical protein
MTLEVAMKQGVTAEAAIDNGKKTIDSMVDHGLVLILKWSS